MEWILVILFVVAIGLLVASFFTDQTKKQDEQLERFSVSLMEEIQELQKQIRQIELDNEITAAEAGVKRSSEERQLVRQVLDLHQRGYSIESIAMKVQQPEQEVERLIAPFVEEGRQVVHDA
ncbi:hypothetical protein [Halalkalibacterium halodurans]|jgi:uncharacterized protein involved in exopolysaccharide biosynthesis|uniref:Uncharacterized protein n=1 Tax=Halalkalibacterium halodurans TaxID=86665 RepID=A0A0M0KKE2_ALKHA|nr:hypothetical protein [Halalkalibacterium halodurans]TPE70193.1 hypothetical protein AMD02_004775 [Halalkalibacterium halodurans]